MALVAKGKYDFSDQWEYGFSDQEEYEFSDQGEIWL
jgi:hypothetical protein